MTTRSNRSMRPLLSLCVIGALSLVGCGVDPPAKDGGAARTRSLSAVAYTGNSLTGETMTQLVADVSDASSGTLSLTLGQAVDAGAQDGSAEVIGMVRDGTVDLGIVAARTFDLEGATSLQALNVPLAVESPDQAARFLSDPMTGPMLDGLEQAGVVGLALTYDQMRQPLGFAGPLHPQDLRGARVLARPSSASSAVFAALGATADLRNGEAAEDAMGRGEVVGAETSMERASGTQTGVGGETSVVTANVQLSVKANVLIVNPSVWDGLTPDQRDALREAAAATQTWASRQVVTLSSGARAFCANHVGDVVIADAAELRAWERAVAPAVADLAADDPLTAQALDRMAEIVREFPSTDLPVACSMEPASEMVSVTPNGDQSVVLGTWRLLVSADAFSDAGASAQDVALNVGTWTFVFRPDGSYEVVEPQGRSCPGTYAVAGDRLSLREDVTVGDCDGRWELTLRRDGDVMTWAATAEFEATYPPFRGFFAHPLERIGGPSR